MEEKKEPFGMLDLLLQPGFYVKENRIIQVNASAESLFLQPDTDVRELLLTGQEEYAAFSGGCLYLKLSLSQQSWGASVTRMDGYDVFVLDPEQENSTLRHLALAARELRDPLTSIMISSERLLPMTGEEGREHAARLNRGLHQLLRIIGNMSDAGSCSAVSRQETVDLTALFREIFEKAQTLVDQAGLTLTYAGPGVSILGLADGEQLERAVLNILSNAMKFSSKGGTIQARLTVHGRLLQLSILDSGCGMAQNVLSSVFTRYLRQPGIEDSRYGLGLGMVLIRSAAANHGGTVLIDQPYDTGTRVTMTLSIRQNTAGRLHSPIMRVDYAGERDHGRIELSDCLPISAYAEE